MTEIDVARLEEAKKIIESGRSCYSITIYGGFTITSEAIQWLKQNHWHLKVIETFGETGVAVMIYPI